MSDDELRKRVRRITAQMAEQVAGELAGETLVRLGTDARAWAAEFVTRQRYHWYEDEMVEWFAAAIEAGRSAAESRVRPVLDAALVWRDCQTADSLIGTWAAVGALRTAVDEWRAADEAELIGGPAS
jgi:hypothetical protein